MDSHSLMDEYCVRIGYHGPREPTLETLGGIHEAHAQAIPFENLDILLGRPIALEPAAIAHKLLRSRRGGYCFEQNSLLLAVLQALGFAVTPMLARVRWLAPAGAVTPLTHMALRVDIEDRAWLADAGFGGVGLVGPLALDRTGAQETGRERRRLLAQGGGLLQQVEIGGAWTDVYVLYPAPAYAVDFEVANWYTSTHPASRFRQHLMAARARGEQRLSLFNREFTIRHVSGSVQKRTLQDPDELLDVLAGEFGLEFPPATRFECPGLRWE